MTDEQKFFFDLKGWIRLPGVLTQSEIRQVTNFLYQVQHDPDSMPVHQRNSYSGPCEALLDHPAIVPILSECMDTAQPWQDGRDTFPPVTDVYDFRVDSSVGSIQEPGATGSNQPPHCGFPPCHDYRVAKNRIVAPSIRVVWELAPIEQGAGGTHLLSGSHKANFKIPDTMVALDSGLYEENVCPAGSALIFSEATVHAGMHWHGPGRRITVLNHYCHHTIRFHRTTPSHETIMALAPHRRVLFRDVWALEFEDARLHANDYYSATNRAS